MNTQTVISFRYGVVFYTTVHYFVGGLGPPSSIACRRPPARPLSGPVDRAGARAVGLVGTVFV